MRRDEDQYTDVMRKRKGGSGPVKHAATRIAALRIACQKAIHERDQALLLLNDAYIELARLHAVKSDFAAMMNNEFRTVLLSIQDASEIIRDDDLSSVEAREFAVDIYADAQRLLHMIADQLAFNGVTTERKRLQWGWFNLNAIIIDVVDRLRPTTNHQVRLQLARALPILMGDHEKLTYVITHLLKNAVQNSVQYLPNGGEICVRSQVEGHMIHVCICDQGIGISALALEKIFADRACSDAEPLALPLQGLPTVREIVQMHGGEIWVESSLETGSFFHFTIPFTRNE